MVVNAAVPGTIAVDAVVGRGATGRGGGGGDLRIGGRERITGECPRLGWRRERAVRQVMLSTGD